MMPAPSSNPLLCREPKNSSPSSRDEALRKQRHSLLPLFNCPIQFIAVCTYSFPARVDMLLINRHTIGGLQNNRKAVCIAKLKDVFRGPNQCSVWNFKP